MNILSKYPISSASLLLGSVFAVALCALSFDGGLYDAHASQTWRLPVPLHDESHSGRRIETAVLAGGCFWGLQGVFQHVEGVMSVTSGYAGGEGSTARYDLVSLGTSDHAEAVKIKYDPTQVSFGELLQIFFSVGHDPTQINRQGPDVGTQYRSAIFPLNPQQASIASAYISQLHAAKIFDGEIATRIESGKSFFPAEVYHQNFLSKNPTHPYIVVHDLPKIRELERLFANRFRTAPLLTTEVDGQ